MKRSILFEDAIDVRDKMRKLSETVVKPWGYNYEPSEQQKEERALVNAIVTMNDIQPTEPVVEEQALDNSDYNAATGSYSGAYGKGPVDDATRAIADSILSGGGNDFDDLLSSLSNPDATPSPVSSANSTDTPSEPLPDASDFNATTGSYSGSYGKGHIDESTKNQAADILAARGSEIDELLKRMAQAT